MSRAATIGDMYTKVLGLLRKEGKRLVYGQSTLDASEEASFLVARSLTRAVALEGGVFDKTSNSFVDVALQKAFRQPVTKDEEERILKRTRRRIAEQLPAAYIVGEAYQQGCLFKINEDVLIPRSYIGEILRDIPAIDSNIAMIDHSKVKKVLELCTGSGCLAILASRFLPGIQEIDAVDICPKALEVAKQNVVMHGLANRINLHQGDLYDRCGGKKYDLIIANPPYVRSGVVKKLPKEYQYEPAIALEGGENGLSIIDRILLGARDHLKDEGRLLLEIGTGFEEFSDKYPVLTSTVTWVETSDSTHELLLASRKDLKKVTPRTTNQFKGIKKSSNERQDHL